MNKKCLVTFLLVGCLTLILSAGVLSAHGTVTNQSNNGSMSNQSYDRQGMNTDRYHAASTTGGDFRANAVNDDNGMDWDWLGWLGLLGLFGLRGRSRHHEPDRS
ncbi:WGxxGxxG family protein [Paenibacillus sp. GCM10023250]|uniref:WGxxGxxG family protein n=1 Tax=Paenibacillus sp. GCM10023250 TaxID=3252648 RepID=UPI003612B939